MCLVESSLLVISVEIACQLIFSRLPGVFATKTDFRATLFVLSEVFVVYVGTSPLHI